MNKRIEMKLKSTSDKPLSGWQLQDFISSLNKGYNKVDLINYIAGLLNQGEKPENLLIINKSYEINNNYTFFRENTTIDLKDSVSVEKLYNLGRPIPLFPNRKIYEIKLIFNLYESIYSDFRRQGITPISKSKLKDYINISFNEGINKIQEDCLLAINDFNNNEKIDKALLVRQVKTLIGKIEGEYKKYILNEDNIERLKKVLSIGLKFEDTSEFSFQNGMKNAYFDEFFKLFRSIDRPILLKYKEENNEVELIKPEYMLNDVHSENFLDYKDYSHNSPFVITIIAGVAIASIIGLLVKGIQEEIKNEETNEENEKMESDIFNELKEISDSLSSENSLNQLANISNPYIRSCFEELKGKIDGNTLHVLKSKKVVNKNIVIKLSDYRNEKGDVRDKNN